MAGDDPVEVPVRRVPARRIRIEVRKPSLQSESAARQQFRAGMAGAGRAGQRRPPHPPLRQAGRHEATAEPATAVDVAKQY